MPRPALALRLLIVGMVISGSLLLMRRFERLQEHLRSRLLLVVTLSEEIRESERESIENKLKKSIDGIKRIAYTSPEEAFQEGMKNLQMSELLQVLGRNPFPGSYAIELSVEGWLNRSTSFEAVRQMPGIQMLQWDSSAVDLLAAMNRYRKTLWCFIVFLWSLVVAWAGWEIRSIRQGARLEKTT